MTPIRQLSAEECEWLFRVFRGDFRRSSFRGDRWARWVARRAGAEGITFGGLVCLRRQEGWQPEDLFALVAHELVHVAQYRRLGFARFIWRYVREYLELRRSGLGHHAAYVSLSYERQARAIEEQARALVLAGRGLANEAIEAWAREVLQQPARSGWQRFRVPVGQ